MDRLKISLKLGIFISLKIYLNKGIKIRLALGIWMGEETSLTKVSSKSKSLRTYFPISFAKQFGLKEGDRLDWKIEARDSELIITVRPVKSEESKKVVGDTVVIEASEKSTHKESMKKGGKP